MRTMDSGTSLSSSDSSVEMQRRSKSPEYVPLKEEQEENTRWHEGHNHEGEQHFHHITFPKLDIETDDAEFFDPTEGMWICIINILLHHPKP